MTTFEILPGGCWCERCACRQKQRRSQFAGIFCVGCTGCGWPYGWYAPSRPSDS